MSALFIILLGLTMTLFSDNMLIFHSCICGLMPNLIKKSWTVSNKKVFAFGILHRPEKSHKYSNARNIYAVLTRYEIEKDFQSKVLQIKQNKTIRIGDFQLRKKFKIKNSTKCQLEIRQKRKGKKSTFFYFIHFSG